jgi:hypothetical protein
MCFFTEQVCIHYGLYLLLYDFFSSDLPFENRIDLELDHSLVQLFSNLMCNKCNPILSSVVSEPLESLGDSISTAVVLSWGKEAGEAIAESDVIATVETDKVTMDIRAKKAGVFVEGLVPVKGEVRLFVVCFSSSSSNPFMMLFYSVLLHRLLSVSLFTKWTLMLLPVQLLPLQRKPNQ